MLRPLHQWKLKKDGTPARDSHGQKILHPKAGQAKTESEMTPDELANAKNQLAMAAERTRKSEQDSKFLKFMERL